MATKKQAAISKKYTKSQIISEISESTDVSREKIKQVMDELSSIIERHLKKRGGCKEFTLPGILKIITKEKPAQKARKGVPNPFRPGETMDVPAKPKTIQVKVRPLKKLKEYALS